MGDVVKRFWLKMSGTGLEVDGGLEEGGVGLRG